MEVLPNPNANDPVRYHDVSGYLSPRYSVREDQPSRGLCLPRLHPKSLLPLRSVLCPILRQAQEEQEVVSVRVLATRREFTGKKKMGRSKADS